MSLARISARTISRTARRRTYWALPSAVVCSSASLSARQFSVLLPAQQEFTRRSTPPGPGEDTVPLKPLPALPPAPGHPAPVITQHELTQFLVPLYERDWRIVSRNNVNGLQKRAKITKYSEVVSFVKELSNYAVSERHHPEITFGFQYVLVWLVTHTAVTESYSASGESPVENQLTQGITLRDIRLAILAERLFQEFVDRGHIVERVFATGRAPLGVDAFDNHGMSKPTHVICYVCGKRGHYAQMCPTTTR